MKKNILNSLNLMRNNKLNYGIRGVLLVLLFTLGIGNAWGSTTYYSKVTTSQSPTGKGTVYVATGSTFSGTSTNKTQDVSNNSTHTYSLQATPTEAGYYFVNWTSTGTATLSFSNANSAATTCSISNCSSNSSSRTTGNAQANWAEITIGAGVASPASINATDNSTTCTDYTGTMTFATKADAKNDFKDATPPIVNTGHGTFSVTSWEVASNGTVTVNYKFVGDGTYGGNVTKDSRSRNTSATLTLTAKPGNNFNTCTVTASFPNITIAAGEGTSFNATLNEEKQSTATFAVEYADDADDFTAEFSDETTGSTWGVDDISYADGVVTVTYTFNSTVADTHTATLTLTANDNAGGSSNTAELTAISKAKANDDASVTYNNTTTNYSTIAAAISAANSKPGAVVTLLRNIPSETTPSLSSPLNITGMMTLDLNSYTIARAGMADGSQQVITVNMSNAASVLTIKDSSVGHDGKISGTGGSNGNMLYAVCMEKGVLNFESGIVECTNTNSGDNAKATGIRVKNGCKLLMQGGTINATTSGNPARGIYATTTSSNAQMVVVSGGFINTKAANSSVGIDCESTDTPSSIDPDPTKANVILSGVTVDAQTTGTIEAIAVRSGAGVILGVQNGSYTATSKTTTAYAVQSSGHTAILGGTFNATATTTTARGLHVAGGIAAVKGGTFTAIAETDLANGADIESGAKLLSYGGTFKGRLTKVAAEKFAIGTNVKAGGALEAQGGTFIGEAANTTLASAQKAYACGVYGADGNSTINMSSATMRGEMQSTYMTNGGNSEWNGGAYGFYSRSTNPCGLTNCVISATSAYQGGFGIRFANTPAEVKNCIVTVNTTYAYNYGIFVGGSCDLKVYNSKFTCTSGTTWAYGIYAYNGTTYAENSEFNVTTQQSTATSAGDCNLYGVKVNSGKRADLVGCTINATGNGNYSNNGYGVYVDGSSDIDNCKVTVSSINTNAYALVNSSNTTWFGVASGKFSATAKSGTIVSTNGTAAATKQQLYGGYYKQNTNLAKYLPTGYGIETLPSGSTEYSEGYRYAIRPTTNLGTPVCKIGATPYTTLEEALEYANKNSGTTMTILMVANYTLPAGNYTLPANATLLVPYKSDQTSAIGTGETGYVASYTNPSLFRKLTFADGVNMTVLGTIEVSAEKYLTSSNATGIPTGPYGQIVLDGTAHIDLEENAKLVAWGYVTGNGDINAKNKSSIYELFQLLDMKGGGVTSQLINDSRNPNIFPITHYAYQNVEATITYRPGSKAIGWTGANVQSSNQVANNVMMVGNMNSGALFLMADEGVSSDTWVRKKYNPTTDRAEYTLNNTATLGSINVNLSSINMASASYILPIASNMTITLKYGTMTITQNTYFMPGSILNIEKEAKLTIPSGKELYFVDKNQWVKGYAPAQYVCVVKYSPSFNNGKGGDGATYSPRKGLISANTNLPPAELFAHGDIVVEGALYTTESGANIHSTNADAGTITFNSIAADKDFCQLNSTCGEGAGGPGGSSGGATCGKLEKLTCTYGTCDCYYWNWNTWPCTSAQLKNNDNNSFTSSVIGGAGTYVYKNGAWVKVEQEGCFTTETDGSGKHYYANPSDIVEVVRNSDNSYRDVESGFRRFVWDSKCEWWEVETTPTSEGYYKSIKADHNERYNYYEYNSSADYWQVKNVTVTWNVNGTTTNYSVGYGTHPKYLSAAPSKAATASEYYTWMGWTKGSTEGEFYAKEEELPAVTGNTTFYAYFEAHKFEYTITFKNYDGAVLEAKRWPAGETPVYDDTPTKPSTAALVYAFTGWSPAIAAVSEPKTYTAQFDAGTTRTYTIQWVNYDGKVLKEEQVAYNTAPSAPASPTRPNDTYYTYTFNAWSPAISTVSGNQTYTATYNYEKKVTKYAITFKNGSTTVYTQNLPDGETPVFDGTTPTKAADAQYTYTFDGWSATEGGAVLASLPAVSGAAKTYYAHFSTTTNAYTIRWKSIDGKQLYETDENVLYGATPEYNSSKPTKDRMGATVYTFDGWSSAIGGAKIALPSVTGNATYYAHFSDDPVYTVTFNANGHGTAPAAQEVVSGQKATQPSAPTATGYTFGGWYKEAGCKNAWNFASDVVAANTTLYAKWTTVPYNLTYEGLNGATNSNPATYTIETATITLANPGTRAGYTFDGWTCGGNPITQIALGSTGDKTITASWTVDSYTVELHTNEGTINSGNVTSYTYGIGATLPNDVTRANHIFEGWYDNSGLTGSAVTNISTTTTGNKEFWAKWRLNNFDVTFDVQGHGTAPDAQSITANGKVTKPDAPSAENYRFDGWYKEPACTNAWDFASDEVTAKMTLYAKWTRLYTITWQVDGVQKKMEQVAEGTTPSYGSVPTKESDAQYDYSFSGWTTEPYAADKDQTYSGTFIPTIRSYTITFMNDNERELWHYDVNYGIMPSYKEGKEVPVSSHPNVGGYTYTFAGWEPALTEVDGAATYKATYNRSAGSITVSTNETITVNTIATTTTVKVKGSLAVEGATLTTDSLILEGSADNNWNMSSGEIKGEGTVSATNAYYDMSPEGGYKERIWYAVAVPWEVSVPKNAVGDVYDAAGHKLRLNLDFDLLYYNGESRATGGTNNWNSVAKDAEDKWVMKPGIAYMIYLARPTSKLRFKKSSGDLLTTSVSVKQYEEKTNNNGKDANWNGIANPALYHAYLNAGTDGNYGQVFVPGKAQRDGGSYTAIHMDEKALVVGQPIFVQAEADTTVVAETSSSEAYPTLAPRRAQADASVQNVHYAVEIASEGMRGDRIFVATNDDKEDVYTIGQDVCKLGTSTTKPQMWVNRYDSKLCVNTMAFTAKKATYPLGISVPADGDYEIYAATEMQDGQEMYVTYNGRAIWNLAYGPYAATLTKGTHNEYGLKLVQKAPTITTGVDNAEGINDANGVRKVLIDDQIYIIREGVVYTINGQQVK